MLPESIKPELLAQLSAAQTLALKAICDELLAEGCLEQELARMVNLALVEFAGSLAKDRQELVSGDFSANGSSLNVPITAVLTGTFHLDQPE